MFVVIFFAMYVDDIKAELAVNGIEGFNFGSLNLYMLLYADHTESRKRDEMRCKLRILS